MITKSHDLADDSLATRTRTAHAGEPHPDASWPLADAIQPATVLGYADPSLFDDRYQSDPPFASYSRGGMPNAASLERAVADLEHAEDAQATASGMAALALTFLSFLRQGDEVVIAPNAYCDTEAILADELAGFGVRTVFADTADPAAVARAVSPRTRLIHAETILNPSLTLSDIPALGRIARETGCLLSVDNTLATPLLARPLDHGADLVIHSVTKFLGGHHDLTAGVICGRHDLLCRLRHTSYLYGPTINPFAAWLAVRGLKTLAARMNWIGRTASQVAAFLEDHPGVRAVRYPGLSSHPQATLVRRLLPEGGGGVMLVELAGGPEAAHQLLTHLRLIPYAPSLGGATTTASYPPVTFNRTGSNGRPTDRHDGAVRLSIGLEDPRDLIADLGQALAAISAPISASSYAEVHA